MKWKYKFQTDSMYSMREKLSYPHVFYFKKCMSWAYTYIMFFFFWHWLTLSTLSGVVDRNDDVLFNLLSLSLSISNTTSNMKAKSIMDCICILYHSGYVRQHSVLDSSALSHCCAALFGRAVGWGVHREGASCRPLSSVYHSTAYARHAWQSLAIARASSCRQVLTSGVLSNTFLKANATTSFCAVSRIILKRSNLDNTSAMAYSADKAWVFRCLFSL